MAASPAGAQVVGTQSEGTTSVYRYADAGEVTITVDLLGAVARPGRYVLRPGVDALDLLVLAGGPALADDAGARTATFSVVRGEGDAARAVRATVAALTDGTERLPLEDGDVVTVRTAGPGTISTSVDVWGAVGRPGRYSVEPGTTLLDLLTLAGGPSLTPVGGAVARTATVTLSRLAPGGARTVVYEGPVDGFTTAAPPPVEPGDLVTVRVVERQRFGLRDVLTVVSAATGVAILVLRLVEAGRN